MKNKKWYIPGLLIFLLTSCTNFQIDLPLTMVIPTIKINTTQPEISTIVPKETLSPTISDLPDQTLTPTQISQKTPSPEITEDLDPPILSPTPSKIIENEIPPPKTQDLLRLQNGSPVGLPNFSHPDLGCKWMGIAGQVFDKNHEPWEKLVIEVGGTLNGNPVLGLAVTGETVEYGPGGYEIALGDRPIESNESVWVQISNLEGEVISQQIYFSTYPTCDKNLILLNFVQDNSLSDSRILIPLIFGN